MDACQSAMQIPPGELDHVAEVDDVWVDFTDRPNGELIVFHGYVPDDPKAK